MRPLVWFRGDLRTGDNPALSSATREASRGVVGVFNLCPDQWREHDWASVRVDFVLRNLAELQRALARLNIPLLVARTPTSAGTAGALLGLANEHGCDALYLNRELEVNECRRDARVREAFEAAGMGVHQFHDQCILPPGEVLTGEGKWYTVFSPFRRKFGEVYRERGGVGLAAAPRKQVEMVCPPGEVPTRLAGFDTLRRADLWPAGERAARARLRGFIAERISAYHEQRDAPAILGSSTLSPYLASGVLSVRECLLAAIEADGRPLSEKRGAKTGPGAWIDELVWREFYRHLLVGFPRLCMGTNFRREYDRLPWRESEADLAAWREGRTGVPIVDAAMRQLAQTGWMHNRCRMITAMFLTKNLLIDWREGERHFMRSLVDGDLASNNGGWQWSSSTGTDAAPYFRVFNPASQSRTHDPEGVFIRRFVPELADVEGDAVHEPWRLPGLLRSDIDYPAPIVDLASSRRRAIEVFRNLKGAASAGPAGR